ncbi:putative leader peptide [Streptomyces triticagri]|uniref:putative leader peptide n=1 Tax=Streptomyces triticagri TaxID=2293568 RepID=UPI0013142E02|nr:putative leader peptide [Streptomyces triticagri]
MVEEHSDAAPPLKGYASVVHVTCRPRVIDPRRRIRLHGRPHIDLRRVAGALCRS